MGLILSTSLVPVFLDGSSPTNRANMIIFLFFYTLSPYISLAIIANALWKLKKFQTDQSSISKTQILIQLFSATAYAFSNTIYFYSNSSNATCYVRISLDTISLAILTHSLCEMASL